MLFLMSRVTEEDFDELLEVQFRAFAKCDLHEALFGPNTKTHRDMVKARFIKDMKEDSADCWMKLVDKNTGKMVSAAQWKIYPSWADLPDHPFELDWWKGEDREMAEFMCKDFMERRAKYTYGHPHVLLYILFTDPEYQKCGAGTVHMKWGTELADRLLLPMWLEASPEGHHLYEQNGFKDVEVVNTPTKRWVSEYTVMKRELPNAVVEAGRAVLPN